VHGAAREIGLTQTGVTQRIRALERELGVTVFTRSRSGMRLTAEGEALNRYCQRVRDMEGELAASLRLERPDETVRLVVTGPSSAMRSRVIPQATRVLGRFPNAALTFDLDDDEPGLKALKTGAAQLAVIPRAEVVAELDSKLLRPMRYVLVVCPAWRRRRLKDVVVEERIVDFNDRDDATLAFLAKNRLAAAARKDRHFANNIDALAAIVAAGHGYSVLADDFAAPLIAEGALAALGGGVDLKIEYALAWYPRPEMPDYFSAVIREIR
jgi:LysR family transcriptional regulator, chromosome initiation inhibitor